MSAARTAKRLLIVDDEREIVDLLAEHFESQGYVVDTALSGREALVSAAARRPDLVLLDVRMPGVDGVEVLNRLLGDDASMPVVIVTAIQDEELAREMLTMGAFDFIRKPFDFQHLDEVVSTALLHER